MQRVFLIARKLFPTHGMVKVLLKLICLFLDMFQTCAIFQVKLGVSTFYRHRNMFVFSFQNASFICWNCLTAMSTGRLKEYKFNLSIVFNASSKPEKTGKENYRLELHRFILNPTIQFEKPLICLGLGLQCIV